MPKIMAHRFIIFGCDEIAQSVFSIYERHRVLGVYIYVRYVHIYIYIHIHIMYTHTHFVLGQRPLFCMLSRSR